MTSRRGPVRSAEENGMAEPCSQSCQPCAGHSVEERDPSVESRRARRGHDVGIGCRSAHSSVVAGRALPHQPPGNEVDIYAAARGRPRRWSTHCSRHWQRFKAPPSRRILRRLSSPRHRQAPARARLRFCGCKYLNTLRPASWCFFGAQPCLPARRTPSDWFPMRPTREALGSRPRAARR
jgi:hypothetical protein